MAAVRDLDIVVWGATGFTGSLAVAYLSGDVSKFHSFALNGPAAPAGMKWAIAGRNQAKLEALNSGVEIIICDSADTAAIEAMVQRAKVIVGFAGPFFRYSDKVVEACAKYGTHWCDITGEIAWHRSLIDRFGHRAKATGACIVNHCGYDSLPSDLGTLFAVNALRSRFGAVVPVRNVTCYQSLAGAMSGGTLGTSVLEKTHPVVLSAGVDNDDVFLLGGETAAGVRKEDLNFKEACYDEVVERWCAPFMMASINTRVVRRSSMLLGYGANFCYQERKVEASEESAKKTAHMLNNPAPPEVIKALIEAGKMPKSGEGPSPEARAKHRFLGSVLATGEEKSQEVLITVSGGDCGYEETAKMATEAAMALVFDGANCPGLVSGGGFLTPAACMGTALIDRLHRAGIKFEVLPAGAPAGAQGKDAVEAFEAMLAKQ